MIYSGKPSYSKRDLTNVIANRSFETVYKANREDIRIVIDQFEQFARAKVGTVKQALNDLRAQGFTISKSGLNRGRKGEFNTISLTWLNILSVYCGYNGLNELLRYCPRKGEELPPNGLGKSSPEKVVLLPAKPADKPKVKRRKKPEDTTGETIA